MKVLVIGAGGREHAIAKKLTADQKVTEVYCAPGNPGMAKDGIRLVGIAETNHPELIKFAQENQIAWTFVGPEMPLLNGIVDDFEAAGLKIFGPNKKAAMIEGSKEFAKKLMADNHISTADYAVFTDFESAKAYVESKKAPLVVKADGLAAGKGVVVATTQQEAVTALKEMLENKKFGDSGGKVVVEDFLSGEEFSLLAFVNYEEVYPMVIAQDHKRAFDHDFGPNTGGMGAYTPVPQIPEALVQKAVEQVLHPAASGMVRQGTPFKGILYAGLIATEEGVKVIEFNARFGDPETQVVLSRLESGLGEIITDLLHDRKPTITWNQKHSVGVVVAAEGYPEKYPTGMPLSKQAFPDVNFYYAGVAGSDDDTLIANGGRIFLAEASEETLENAQEKVYAALSEMDLPDMFYRKDIGAKALAKR